MANIKKSFNFRNGVQVDDDNLKVSATGLVGIGTTVPTEALDVRGNLVVSGVSSAATIQAGVLTVTTFNPTSIIGAGISVVSGVVTASSGIVTYYGDARFLQGLPTSQWEDVNTGFGVSSIYNTGGNVGIATSNPQFTLQVGGDVNSNKDGVGISSAGNIKISGIASASQFSGNLTGNISSDTVVSGIATFSKDIDVDGHTNLDNVSIAGVTTFTGATTHSGGATVNTQLDVIGLTTLDDVNVSSGATFGGAVNVTGNLQSANLGLGVAPNTDLQIFNSTGESQMVLGNSSAITGTNAAIRYNSSNASFPFSSGTPQSLDIINYGKGSINFYLEAGTVGLGTGDINFIRRSNFDELMTLTYGGRLGIGVTVPTDNLHVVGTSTVTGNSFAGGNISAGNNIIAANQIQAASLSVPRVDSTLFGNVNSTSGISTFQSLKTTGTTQGTSAQFATGVGIGVTASGVSLSINSATSNRFTFTQGGSLRIKGTTINDGIDLETNVNDGRVLFGARGVGTTAPRAAVDFADAGKNTTIVNYQNRMYMLPPKLTTSQRTGLSTETGAVIYNTSTNKLQVYTGSAWANCN